LTRREIVDNIEQLIAVLPPRICDAVQSFDNLADLVEIVMDLGREPEARFSNEIVRLSDAVVSREEIDFVLERVGQFGKDNRAGIERTLHRISAMRNRQGAVVGITCRVGRAVFGTLDIVRDIVELDRSVLFLGRPGIGKTTMLREFARVLADDLKKRVVIVDTSNEIAGDGDIPHPAIGRARRMQVPLGVLQADVMIEAVENHMPEVIVIDEIGTEAEAEAARTIAERGVRLIGTAHGNTLENLVLNPTLSDLVGGVQTVTLGDEEARKRGTQKTVLERKAPPTFDVLIEIQEKDQLAVCKDVSKAVDRLLRGATPKLEVRRRASDGSIEVVEYEEVHAGIGDVRHENEPSNDPVGERSRNGQMKALRIFPYGVSRNRLERAVRDMRAPVLITKTLQDADMVLTLKGQYRKMPKRLKDAEERGLPIKIVRSNTVHQIEGILSDIVGGKGTPDALQEVEDAILAAKAEARPIQLAPQNAAVRRSQHKLVERHRLQSTSIGTGPERRVVVLPHPLREERV